MRFFTLILVLLFLVPPALFSQSKTPALWQKAVTIQSNNMDWTPGEMTMRFELLDKNGQADMVDITKYKFTPGEDGEQESVLVSASHNGEDVTEKRKEQEEKEKSKQKKDEDDNQNSVGFSLKESPFHPDNQSAISVKSLDESKNIAGKSCAAFSYSLPLDEGAKEGTVWIDVGTGAPVRHEFTTTPLPPKMKEMKNIVKFTYTPDKKLYISQMMFEGVGGVLFIKKSFRGTMDFADYWENPAK